MENQGEIILYQPDETVKVEVRLEDEMVWLNRQQLSVLFDRDIKTIGKHINNALSEELKGISVVAKFAITASDGKTYNVEHYSLDMVLSVGYRVKSHRGIRFRAWANQILKDYLLKGYSLSQRLIRTDAKLMEHDRQIGELKDKVNFFIRTSLPPVEGIFFNGQIFDAYVFAANLIKSAKKTIVLIDNYVDESVLVMLSKRAPGVKATIYTGIITPQLKLDLLKSNSQYPKIDIRLYKQSHDRFLIIDNTDVYHIGSSLKDLGKKWFAFSKINIPVIDILSKL
ncbi:MAG: virulence RhuM family protein [Mediterranea sp.]|jgi:hypothetical protein|nr:virulence RhuM family protein [Mediterranea sp.]